MCVIFVWDSPLMSFYMIVERSTGAKLLANKREKESSTFYPFKHLGRGITQIL